MEKKEGPSKVIIPAQEYMSCSRCKYLKHQMVKSGRDPVYKNTCSCPPNDKEYSIVHRTQGKEIPRSYDMRIETPEWCPLQIKSYDNEPETDEKIPTEEK